MKKFLLLTGLLFSVIQVNAEYSIKDIINDNTQLNEKQRLEEIKKIPAKERLDLVNNLNQPFKKIEQANKFISILYNLPKDAFNDKESMNTFMDNLYVSITLNDGNTDFYNERTKKENFNIYYETMMITFSSPKAKGDLSYAEYDKFYSKLLNRTLNFKKEADRKFFFALNEQMDFSIDFDDDDENATKKDENSGKIKVLNQYIQRPEFKNYKIKNNYHIYLLGAVIFEKYNDYTADFISKKINDKNSNLENLCYFLDSLRFESKISPTIEKEFDDGFYNPQTDPFKLWRNKQIIDVRDIEGTGNLIIQEIKNNHINISTAQRLKIIYADDFFHPNFNNYKSLVLEQIDKIGNDNNIKDKTSAVMKVIDNYYTIAKKEYDERNRIGEERLEKLNEQFNQLLEENPDFNFGQ